MKDLSGVGFEDVTRSSTRDIEEVTQVGGAKVKGSLRHSFQE